MVIDKNWFLSQMKRRELTQRKAAKALGMDPSALSLLLNGKRKMKLTEVPRFAEVLGAPPRDVMGAAGIDVRTARVAKGEMPVMGRIDENGVAELTARPISALPLVSGIVEGVALRFESALTKLDPVDGWYVVVSETPVSADQAMGRMALCEMEDGALLLRWLRKGYEVGSHRLTWVSPQMETAAVVSARPVLLVVPSQS